MNYIRVTTEEQLSQLVSQIKEAILPEQYESFMEARFNGYDKVNRVDSHVVLKEATYYLPYPQNKRFVAKLYDNHTIQIKDDFSI